jgi:hypothetical protein
MQCLLYKIYFWKGFLYVLQIDMHLICAPMLTKFYSCKKWVLQASSPMAGHGAQSRPMAALPWRALTKAIFHRGITKTDVHDLPLTTPTLNFI